MREFGTVMRMAIVVAGVTLLGRMIAVAEGPILMTSGKITMVDPQRQVVKLKTGFFTTKQFTVDHNTKITNGQRQLELSELEPGAEATVEYQQKGDKQVAQAISLISSGFASSAAGETSNAKAGLTNPPEPPRSNENQWDLLRKPEAASEPSAPAQQPAQRTTSSTAPATTSGETPASADAASQPTAGGY